MTKSQLELVKKALTEVEKIEVSKLEQLPNVEFLPSEEYNQKINALIESERKRESSLLKLTRRKKISVLVAAISILLVLLTACAFRKQIKGFIIEIRDTMMRLSYSYADPNSKYIEHSLTYIPEGYFVYETNIGPLGKNQGFYNGEHYIWFDEGKIKGSIQISIEDASYELVNIGGFECHRTYRYNTYCFVWKNDTNSFMVMVHDSIPMDEIEKIILGVKPAE